MPEDRAALEALPGSDVKPLNVVLNTAFWLADYRHDTHIFRRLQSDTIAPGKNVEQVEKFVKGGAGGSLKLTRHHWLILHGRYTCIARKPRCGSCLIEDLCEYKER